jgi:PQQ-like domain
MNTEERQLSDLLHRLTPEPPRPVTVEDVAFRLANQAGRGSRLRVREPRPRRGRTWGRGVRGLAPVLAAASVFLVAGASAGIAVMMTSNHRPASAGGNLNTASASVPTSASSAPTQAQTSGQSTLPSLPLPTTEAPWGAKLIQQQTLSQDSLVSGDGSLYAVSPNSLDRIDPATGAIVGTTAYSAPIPNPPVVLGDTVWIVWSYGGGLAVLHGYDASTLAQVASWTVPGIGQVSSTAQGVLTAGPDGHLYLAAGGTVAVVDPATGHVVQRITLQAGPASSVAVSPDGNTMYVAVGAFRLLVYHLAGDHATEIGSSALRLDGAGANLVATSGGVWGTLGVGITEWVWFAPGGDLARWVRVGQGAGAGLASVPTYSAGAVWIGGSHTLYCADPATGQVLASAGIPTGNDILEYFASVTVTGGQAYAYYLDAVNHLAGVVRMTPPAACTTQGS